MKSLFFLLFPLIIISLFLSHGCKKDDNNISKSSFTDPRDGKVYKTVTIGDQVWMAENLKTTQYRNGEPIEYPGNDNNAWVINTNGAYAWYNNDISHKDSYGALYNWYAVNNANGLCPEGWHLPSDEEWKILEGTVDSQYGLGHSEWDQVDWRGSDVGKKLKATTSWTGDGSGTDDYGLGVLAGGRRNDAGHFGNIGSYGYWWSSTEYLTLTAWYRYLYYDNDKARRSSSYKASGFSVRCLKD